MNTHKKKRPKLRFLRFVWNTARYMFNKLLEIFWFVIITTGYLAWLILLTPNPIYPITISIQSPHAEFHSSGIKLSNIQLKPKPIGHPILSKDPIKYDSFILSPKTSDMILMLDKQFTKSEADLLIGGFTNLMQEVPKNANIQFCSELYSSYQFHKSGVNPKPYYDMVGPILRSKARLFIAKDPTDQFSVAYTNSNFWQIGEDDDFAMAFNSNYLNLKVPKENFTPTREVIASVLLHEMMHNRGFDHQGKNQGETIGSYSQKLSGNVIQELGDCVARNGQLKQEDTNLLKRLTDEKTAQKVAILGELAQERANEAVRLTEQNTVEVTASVFEGAETMNRLRQNSLTKSPPVQSPNSHLQTNQENEGF